MTAAASAAALTPPPPGRRLRIMGVLNVTPDSFSDGGAWSSVPTAVRHGRDLVTSGADLVDVGGESTRPGAQRVPVEEELRRVLPVIAELTARHVPSSIDTTRASVATAAVRAGAVVVNDVSGGLADPDMLPAVAELGVPVVLMHWRAPSLVMNEHARYADVVAEVRDELSARVDAALAAGVPESAIVLDPGLGFAKLPEHNWTLLARLAELDTLGLPLLIGASRKRFLPASGHPPRSPRDLAARDAATAAITTLVALHGVWGVRVHDVEGSAKAAEVVTAWQGAGTG